MRHVGLLDMVLAKDKACAGLNRVQRDIEYSSCAMTSQCRGSGPSPNLSPT
jgi:hypothetical protein